MAVSSPPHQKPQRQHLAQQIRVTKLAIPFTFIAPLVIGAGALLVYFLDPSLALLLGCVIAAVTLGAFLALLFLLLQKNRLSRQLWELDSAAGSAAPGYASSDQAAARAGFAPAARPAAAGPARRSLIIGLGCLALVTLALLVFSVGGYALWTQQSATQTRLAQISQVNQQSTALAGTQAFLQVQATRAEQTARVYATQTRGEGNRQATAAQRLMLSQTAEASRQAARQTHAVQTANVQATVQMGDTLDNAARQVCERQKLPEAAAYSARQGPHAFWAHPFSMLEKYEAGYRAANPGDLQVVVCLEDGWVTRNRKPYSLTGYGRSTHYCNERVFQMKITIRAAQTGQQLLAQTLRGDPPAQRCASTETFFGGSNEKYYDGNSYVDPDKLWALILSIVGP